MLERRVVEVEIREATVADFHQMQLPRFSPVPRKRTALEELQLTTRTANSLRRLGCKTVDDICGLTEEQLLRTPNLGRKSLSEIKKLLASMGRALAQSF
jgi:DNA-directed RNA polymerase subunit alpha